MGKQGAPDPRTGAVAVVSALDGLMPESENALALSAGQPLEKGDGRNVIDALQPAKSPRRMPGRWPPGLPGAHRPAAHPGAVGRVVTATGQDPARAFDRLIDENYWPRPANGERWGRHWLDVARYADNMGAIFMATTPTPSPTLIAIGHRGFNHDEPYDRFILDQLAADLLPDLHPEDNRRLAASVSDVGRRTDAR